MSDSINIEIVSPEHLVFSEEAQSITVPGSEGYFTVMGEHAPLMSTLKPGFVTVSGAGDPQIFYVQGGFADISPLGVTILAEVAKTGADFDRAEIEAFISAAEENLAKSEELADKDVAQTELDGWKNLLIDAAQSTNNAAH